MKSFSRLLICVSVAVISFMLLYFAHIEILTRIVISWDVFGLCMIISSLMLFFRYEAKQIQTMVQKEDQSRTIVFTIILISILISLSGILILFNNKTKGMVNTHIHAPFSFLGVAISWFLLHTIFTFRYAHRYYGDKSGMNSCRGISFPNNDEPDYFDFAYFSFVIGMTFQVSDTNITMKPIRRIVLLHSLISFAYNTIIVALSISLLVNLI